MKKTMYYFMFAVLGVLWVFALYRGLAGGHIIGLVLCVILLAPITFRLIRGFLAVVSNEKEDDHNIADDFEPFSYQSSETKQPDEVVKFCSKCGKKNSVSDKFCSSCGNPL